MNLAILAFWSVTMACVLGIVSYCIEVAGLAKSRGNPRSPQFYTALGALFFGVVALIGWFLMYPTITG